MEIENLDIGFIGNRERMDIPVLERRMPGRPLASLLELSRVLDETALILRQHAAAGDEDGDHRPATPV